MLYAASPCPGQECHTAAGKCLKGTRVVYTTPNLATAAILIVVVVVAAAFLYREGSKLIDDATMTLINYS